MKKLLSSLFLGLFVLLQASAVPVDSTNAVTLVSYEQSWLDYEATLALKNNTSEEIHNVTFLITYLDMSGKELDYEEFFKMITILPGKTKKIDIPAYEYDRSYHYYKSENKPTGSPAFKINFTLKGYNTERASSKKNDYGRAWYPYPTDSDVGWPFIILVIVYGFVALGILIGLYVLVATMAKKRNRNVALWVLLSIIASPILIIIILLVIGDDERFIDNRNNDDRFVDNFR